MFSKCFRLSKKRNPKDPKKKMAPKQKSHNSQRYLCGALKAQLAPLEHKAVEKFSFEGLSQFAKVTKIIDGDTFWCAIPYPISPVNEAQQFVRICVRMAGIDTAEKRSEDEEERELAARAKERLIELIGPESIVYVEFGEADKYGRSLGTAFPVYADIPGRKPINEILVEEQLAIPYAGGTKVKLVEFFGRDIK